MTIWRMRIACWITQTTDTHSEYVILIAFPLQQWPQCYIIACLVITEVESAYGAIRTESLYKIRYVLLYSFFLVIPRRLNFICRRFRTLCLFHLVSWYKQEE